MLLSAFCPPFLHQLGQPPPTFRAQVATLLGAAGPAVFDFSCSPSVGRVGKALQPHRFNSDIGYITPKDMVAGHQQEIQSDRDRKLESPKEQRKNRRQRAA